MTREQLAELMKSRAESSTVWGVPIIQAEIQPADSEPGFVQLLLTAAVESPDGKFSRMRFGFSVSELALDRPESEVMEVIDVQILMARVSMDEAIEANRKEMAA